MSRFNPATRQKVHLKLAITGPAGSVKTHSAILIATGLANGGKVAVADSENQSASVYSDRFKFDVLNVSPPFTEEKFIEAIEAAVSEGYAVLIVDSFSHAWLEILDFKAGLDGRGGNSYTNWHKAGAKFNKLMAAILQSKIHIICAMRSKMDYVLEPDIRGKMVPRKVGLAPVMRDGIEYDFSVVFEGDLDHFVSVSKDRTSLFTDQRFQVTEETGRKLLDWLNSAPGGEQGHGVGQGQRVEQGPGVGRVPATEAIAGQPATGPGGRGARGGSAPTPTRQASPPSAEEPSAQERLRQALFGLHPDSVVDFLVNRKKLSPGQTVTDLDTPYCESALDRITAFRKAIIKYGEEHDEITV